MGQGDSELIVTDTAAVLIDAGEQSAADDILADLQQYGITKLDWIIGTHPHADHIGGFPDILSYAAQNSDLTISNVMIPQLPDDMIPTTRTYEKFLDGVDENGLILTQATDITIDLGSASLEIIPSPGNDYSSLNDYSICAYLTCGDTSFFLHRRRIETGRKRSAAFRCAGRHPGRCAEGGTPRQPGIFHRRFSGTAPAQLCSDLLRAQGIPTGIPTARQWSVCSSTAAIRSGAPTKAALSPYSPTAHR